MRSMLDGVGGIIFHARNLVKRPPVGSGGDSHAWLPVVGHHCHQKLVTDSRGELGASRPAETARVIASVSSDDFRQVGLGLD